MGGPVCANPRWSPDGQTILFHSSGRDGYARALHLLHPDTRQAWTVSRTTLPRTRTTGDGRETAARIYFGSDRTGRTGRSGRCPLLEAPLNPVTTQGGRDGHRIARQPLPLLCQEARFTDRDLARAGGWRRGNADRRGIEQPLNFAVATDGLYFVAVGDALHKTSIDFFEFKTGKRTTLVETGQAMVLGHGAVARRAVAAVLGDRQRRQQSDAGGQVSVAMTLRQLPPFSRKDPTAPPVLPAPIRRRPGPRRAIGAHRGWWPRAAGCCPGTR